MAAPRPARDAWRDGADRRRAPPGRARGRSPGADRRGAGRRGLTEPKEVPMPAPRVTPDTSPFAAVADALDHAHRLALDYLTSLPERPVGRGVSAEELAAA